MPKRIKPNQINSELLQSNILEDLDEKIWDDFCLKQKSFANGQKTIKSLENEMKDLIQTSIKNLNYPIISFWVNIEQILATGLKMHIKLFVDGFPWTIEWISWSIKNGDI